MPAVGSVVVSVNCISAPPPLPRAHPVPTSLDIISFRWRSIMVEWNGRCMAGPCTTCHIQYGALHYDVLQQFLQCMHMICCDTKPCFTPLPHCPAPPLPLQLSPLKGIVRQCCRSENEDIINPVNHPYALCGSIHSVTHDLV